MGKNSSYSDITHATINKKLNHFLKEKVKGNDLDPSKYIFEYLEEIPEICENCRGDIFRWNEVPERDNGRLKKFLLERTSLNWIDTAQISKNDKKDLITISDGTNELILELDRELETVTYKLKNKKIKFPQLKLREEKGNFNIYEYEHEFSLDPNIPVDKILKEPISGREDNSYQFFFIASDVKIPASLEKALLFFKFYLASIVPKKLFEITVVISEKTGITQTNLKILKSNGIGLLKFPQDSEEPEVILKPILYEKCFSDYPKKKRKRQNMELVARYYENLIDTTLSSIVGVKSEKFGKSFIDRNLMNKMFELRNISYKDDLIQLITEQLTEKNDEYEFANEVFTKLWPDYIGLKYTDFLKIFEPSLQYIFAETREKGEPIYRDHYLHQFQVFLLGLPIIDKFYDLYKTDAYPQPEVSWLIAASFHDIAYPVQKFDYWSENFFKQVFKLNRNPSVLELKTNFIDEKFLACMGYLICELCCKHFKRDPDPHWADNEDDYVQFFYRKITEEKNHGIMSSISLLKMIQLKTNRKKIEKKLGDFESAVTKIILPGALAIALHDDRIWGGNLYDPKTKKVTKKKFMESLTFNDDPLSFLLILCDSVHEWGRPSKSEDKAEENFGMKFYLKNFDCKSNQVDITLWTPDCTKNHGFYTRKDKELKKIQDFLVQPKTDKKIQFVVWLEDQDGDKDKYIMKGPSR